MADVKNLKIGNTSYNIIDDEALHQVTTLPNEDDTPIDTVVQYMGNDLPYNKKGSIYRLKEAEPTIKELTYSSLAFETVSINPYTFRAELDRAIGGEAQGAKMKFVRENGAWVLYEQRPTWQVLSGVVFANAGVTYTARSGHPADGDEIEFRFNEGRTKSWVSIVASDIVDSLVSENELYALSARQGYVLKNMIDNIGTPGRFLAMWDADTGVARYLDTGFQYERGDYFLVAQVSADPTLSAYYHGSMTINGTKPNNWRNYFPDTTADVNMTYSSATDKWTGSGVTIDGQGIGNLVTFTSAMEFQDGDYITFNYRHDPNYMPTGDTYTGPSTTVATDYLYVSDMYWYDGTRWVYMANHQKQIAVDAFLSLESKNPVENKIITAALNGKQATLTADTGITIDSTTNKIGADFNTVQAKLTAGTNITINSDNVISALGGAGGYPCLSDVSIKQDTDYKHSNDEFLGQYGIITFTTNMDKDTLISKMNDLYFGVYRSKRQMHRSVDRESYSGRKRKMVLQNDKRFKLNKRLYCWRYYDTTTEALDPRSYYYYYTEENYPTVQALFSADPNVYVYTGDDFESNKATCFNIVDMDKNEYHISDVAEADVISRYEAGDISTFEPRPGYMERTYRMFCKECTKNGQRYFLWCYDWEDTAGDVYGTSTAETIPEHMDTLTTQTRSDYTEGDRRPDLDYFALDEDNYSIYDFVEYLYYDTMTETSYPLTDPHINWHGYPFDYPLTPVRLADCEVLISMSTEDYEEGIEYAGTWMKFSVLKDKDFFADLKQVVFRYKYNTAELWLRFSSWQKRCMYQTTSTETGYSREAKNCWTYALSNNSGSNNYAFTKRSFARQRNAYRSYENIQAKFTEYVDFNLVTGADIVHGLMSKSTPIRKRLASWHNGVTTLID